MSEHTPGPWHIAPGNPLYIFSPMNAQPVARCSSKANARLIAAAPDMLAALKEMVAGVTAEYSRRVTEVNFPRAFAAIAKAEGVTERQQS